MSSTLPWPAESCGGGVLVHDVVHIAVASRESWKRITGNTMSSILPWPELGWIGPQTRLSNCRPTDNHGATGRCELEKLHNDPKSAVHQASP